MEPVHTPRPHVCVLGAGIVGLATAWELAQAGVTVTVVDRAAPGQGTSGANGAQLSYAYVQPLADPSLWLQLPKLLLSPDSPLSLRLRFDPWQWAWGLRFLAACRTSVSRRTTERLLALAAESRAGFDDFMARERIDCDFSATGKLVLYADAEGFAGARRQLALQRELGSVQQALAPAECAAVEPALAHYAPRIAGGIHTPGECAADCHKVCQALERLLRARGVACMAAAWRPRRWRTARRCRPMPSCSLWARARPRCCARSGWERPGGCRSIRSRATASPPRPVRSRAPRPW
jgi:D-amino-acid dehydrogenase